MCGIVGYIGEQQAYPILIKGLHRLEYRGYDSAGVSMINAQGDLNVYKAKGKVSALEASVEDKDVSGTIGIAHTRWATTASPTPPMPTRTTRSPKTWHLSTTASLKTTSRCALRWRKTV